MLDPVSLIGVATTAFNGIKSAVQMGREIEDCIGQLSKWAGAVSDIDKAVELTKNPSPFRKFSGKSVQAQAMEAFLAKRKATQMRDELRQLIQYSTGHKGWEDFLRIENEIKKQRQKEVYAAIEKKRKEQEWLLATLVAFLGVAVLAGIIVLGIAINERYT
jgi:hypothetical protein